MNDAQVDGALRIEPISPSIQPQELAILSMRIRKGDSRTLSSGVSGVQGSKREIKKGSRKRKDVDGSIIRRSEGH
jgi:hypothetical protein